MTGTIERTRGPTPWSIWTSRPSRCRSTSRCSVALKPEVRKVVDQFNPSGTVRAHAKVFRVPMAGRPEGLDRHQRRDRPERAVRDHLGQAAVHDPQPHRPAGAPPQPLGLPQHARPQRPGESSRPADRSTSCPASCQRRGPAPGPRRAARPRKLPFSDELRTALPGECARPGETINPVGASDVKATVDVEPDLLAERTHIEIVPLPGIEGPADVPAVAAAEVLDPGGIDRAAAWTTSAAGSSSTTAWWP